MVNIYSKTTYKRRRKESKTKKSYGGRAQPKVHLNKATPVPIPQSQCAPNNMDAKVEPGSCFSTKDIMDIKKAVNERNHRIILTANDAHGIYNQFRVHFGKMCSRGKERCWLKKAGLTETHYKRIFNNLKPEQPDEWKKNPHTWLSNFDIEAVLRDYEWLDEDETKPSDFVLLGPTPINIYDKRHGHCVEDSLCHLKLDHIYNNKPYLGFHGFRGHGPKKTKIGIVFNTDKDNEDGEHWISLFVDLGPQPFILFFDSTGNDPPPEVVKLIADIQKQAMTRLKKRFVMKPSSDVRPKAIIENEVQHQSKNTECGIYALFFLITMLTGRNLLNGRAMTVQQRIDFFTQDVVLEDDFIAKFRDVLFADDDDDVPIIHGGQK